MPILLNFLSCPIIKTPQKVQNCLNLKANFDFHFCRQKFKFEFLAPKLAFSLHISGFFPSLCILSFNSCSNKKMPQIKVLQIGPLYHQLRAFPQILTLTLVKMFENVQKTQMLQKNRVTVPPWFRS